MEVSRDVLSIFGPFQSKSKYGNVAKYYLVHLIIHVM